MNPQFHECWWHLKQWLLSGTEASWDSTSGKVHDNVCLGNMQGLGEMLDVGMLDWVHYVLSASVKDGLGLLESYE